MMSRIRTIRPEFWISEQVVSCSLQARLLFVGMWNFADDNGILPASAFRLKGQVFPHDAYTTDDIVSWIDELIRQSLVNIYQIDDKSYWIITGWKSHQRIDKPTYKYPLPSSTPNHLGVAEHSANVCEVVTQPRRPLIESSTILDEPSPPDWNGLERNGNGTKTCEVKTSPLALSDSSSCASNIVHQPDDPVQVIFAYWCKAMNHPQAKLDKLRQTRIVQALALGYSVDELKQAIDGCAATPFNMGNNDRKQHYDGLDLILRDADHIDRFIANALNPPGEENNDVDVNSFMRGVL